MGYTSGSKILPDILDEIANGLIATAHWQNITSYDASATAWTTTTKTGDSAKRALRYVNGSEEIFLSMTVTNTYRNAVSYTHLRAHETRHDLVCRLLLE